jgi:urease accessory protein
MTATARLLEQRSQGSLRLRLEQRGVAVLREQGASKVRVPRGTHEAILINVSGGLAGGDRIDIRAEVGEHARLTLTTQAAERVYRTLGPPAEVSVSLQADASSTLLWLPQETIFYEGSALHRKLDVEMHSSSTFLAVEPMVFGRHEMGEVLRQVSVRDRWQVRQDGKLMHVEAFALGPEWPTSPARLGVTRAAATLLMVSKEAVTRLERLRAVLGREDGASAWNGKLVARLVAKDGHALRKTLTQAIRACVGEIALPKCWTF